MLLLTTLLVLFGFIPPDSGEHFRDRCPNLEEEKVACAFPVQSPISVDGALDEPAWQQAPVESHFVQFSPNEGAAPSQRTEVRVLYSDDALYVGATLYDDAPERILATLGRRDEVNQADWFYVSIDSYFDRKTAYTFAVNAAGVQLDGIQNERNTDTSWDAVWTSDVRLTPEGWVVELRIPYSMLRFPAEARQTWGINFQREIARLDETIQWALIPRNSGTFVGSYGRLEGLWDIAPRRNVQVTPYSLARIRSHEDEPGYFAPGNRALNVGADFKLGISSNVTLDATINPDFGQVESDPQVLNLSTFETFFNERRPFFVEGTQIFNFDLSRDGNLLYTRRIGAGDTPILGAGKLTGRTAGGFSFGFLGATTGEDWNPERFYGIVRARQEIGDFSYVGGILTGVDRRGEEAFSLNRSLAGGVDWDFRFGDNTYRSRGFTSFSHRTFYGSPDPMTGWAGAVSFDKIAGNWTLDNTFRIYSDTFQPNDLGQLQRNDFFILSLGTSYLLNGNQPFGPFRRAAITFFIWNEWRYADRTNLGLGTLLSTDWELKNYWQFETHFEAEGIGGYDVRETRGLWPYRNPGTYNFSAGLRSDSRRAFRYGPELDVVYTGDGGWGYEGEFGTEWNVGSRITLSAELSYQGEANLRAWTRNERFAPVNDGWGIYDGEIGTYRRFGELDGLGALLLGVPADSDGSFLVPIFGDRDRQQFDFSLRSNVTFTRNLSLQLYTQLFTAKVHYDNFQLLQNPDALAPLPAFPRQYDFSSHGLRVNTVLRWEYRPGSTLFVVWTQGRSGDLRPDAFDRSASPYDRPTTTLFTDTFDLFPDNVFLVKLNYLIMR